MAYNKSGQIPLDQLSDEQNALLNRLACADTGNMGKKHGDGSCVSPKNKRKQRDGS